MTVSAALFRPDRGRAMLTGRRNVGALNRLRGLIAALYYS